MTSTRIANAVVLYGPDLVPSEGTLVVQDGIVAGLDRGARGDVDASGSLLLPGFVDAHVHIGFADPADVLRRGVTSVRDLGWPPDAIFPLAAASRAPGFDGPLILAAGPILTAPGGYPTRAGWAPSGTGREIRDTADADGAVRDVVAAGATIVKIALNPPAGPVLDDDVLRAIVTSAHALGRKVTGHVHGAGELRKAVACGLDELAHMLMSEEELSDADVQALVRAGVTVVPTLSIRFGRDRELAIANLARFRAAGGNVVYGTDLGNEGPEPGIDRAEIAAMAAAGLSSIQIVRCATVGAAEHLSLDGKGVLEEGRDADIVAVPLGALEDPAQLCDVRMVWREGRRVA